MEEERRGLCLKGDVASTGLDTGVELVSSFNSSPSSPTRNGPDALEGLNVSWEGDGDMIGLLKLPVLCFIAVSGLGESSLYFKVVEGSIAMVLLSAGVFTGDLFRGRMGFLDVLVLFIMIAPSSESLSSSYAQRR